MKRHWFIALAGLGVALAAYTGVYFAGTAAQRSVEKSDQPALAWLQLEYQLSDAQYARLRQLHEAYRPECMEMCRRIDTKNAQIQELLARTNLVTPEIQQALAESAQLRTECQAAMLAHFYEVARTMPPEQGKRYLAWMQQETLMPGMMFPNPPPWASADRSP